MKKNLKLSEVANAIVVSEVLQERSRAKLIEATKMVELQKAIYQQAKNEKEAWSIIQLRATGLSAFDAANDIQWERNQNCYGSPRAAQSVLELVKMYSLTGSIPIIERNDLWCCEHELTDDELSMNEYADKRMEAEAMSGEEALEWVHINMSGNEEVNHES